MGMIANEFILDKDRYVWLDNELQIDYIEEKQNKLLFFWSSSCLICEDVASKIRKFIDQNNPDFHLLMVHIPLQENDLKEETIKKKAARYHLNAPIILDHKTELIQQLGVQFVPTIILFNKENKNISQHVGNDNTKNYLESLVGM